MTARRILSLTHSTRLSAATIAMCDIRRLVIIGAAALLVSCTGAARSQSIHIPAVALNPLLDARRDAPSSPVTVRTTSGAITTVDGAITAVDVVTEARTEAIPKPEAARNLGGELIISGGGGSRSYRASDVSEVIVRYELPPPTKRWYGWQILIPTVPFDGIAISSWIVEAPSGLTAGMLALRMATGSVVHLIHRRPRMIPLSLALEGALPSISIALIASADQRRLEEPMYIAGLLTLPLFMTVGTSIDASALSTEDTSSEPARSSSVGVTDLSVAPLILPARSPRYVGDGRSGSRPPRGGSLSAETIGAERAGYSNPIPAPVGLSVAGRF